MMKQIRLMVGIMFFSFMLCLPVCKPIPVYAGVNKHYVTVHKKTMHYFGFNIF